VNELFPRTCRVCGCTDDDCSGYIERTGEPCHWVEEDLCSACAPEPQAKKELKFAIPEGTPISLCRGCGEGIYWIRTAAGKNMPVNPDGVSHFATCEKANTFRKNRS